MLSLQSTFSQPTVLLTSEDFARLVISDDVIQRIEAYRDQLPELERLKVLIKEGQALLAEDPDNEAGLHQELQAEIAKAQTAAKPISDLKAGLPLIIYQATFDETKSKSGQVAAWRKQSAARLNGLYMIDIDHVEQPRKVYEGFRQRNDELGILLVHITPSGHGLRIVAKADAERGNLAANQRWLAQELGLKLDEACKDASRGSFCPSFEDLLHINKDELFTYDNKMYDEKWGDSYRNPSTSSTVQPASSTAQPASSTAQPDSSETSQSANLSTPLPHREGQGGGSSYHGIPYAVICDKWFELVLGGQPSVGDRHGSLYRLACDLRYITDFNPVLLKDILSSIPVGQEIIAERGQAEIERIANDACIQRRNVYLPKRLQEVLKALNIVSPTAYSSTTLALQGANGGVAVSSQQGAGQGAAASDDVPVVIDHEYWYQRLKPFLKEGDLFSEAVKYLPNHLKMGGILASGCMFGTYLTRVWWKHFDGENCRLSYMVQIVGDAASGKSFIKGLDKLIMDPLEKLDKDGREAERQYKMEVKRRKISSKNAKGEAPKEPAVCIRKIPSATSNNVIQRRLVNAVDPNTIGVNGEPMHLHLYTIETEQVTALKAQKNNWSDKLDIELKSFHNEPTGVDYASDESVNGMTDANYNTVTSGTWGDFKRRYMQGNVLNGMSTRLIIFPMPSNKYKMLDRSDGIVDNEREQLLRTIGFKLEQVKGCINVSRLVDFAYDYGVKLARESELEQDDCLDYFRKRIPIIMIRYTLVRIIARQLDAILRGEDPVVTDEDLDFACLIADFCLMAQMSVFGDCVMKALATENLIFTPRKRSNKVREAYAKLPMEGITPELLVSMGLSNSVNAAKKTLARWQEDGLVAYQEGTFKKIFEEIPL